MIKEALDYCGFNEGERFALASILEGRIRARVFRHVEEAEAWIRNEEAQGRNCYLTGNPVREEFEGTRPRAADIAVRRVLLVDVDPPGPVEETVQRIWETIGGTLVDSGRGRQIWLRVPEDADCAGILRRIRSMAGECKVDGTYDASRLMRLPGTRNLKTGRVAQVLASAPSRAPEPLSRPTPVTRIAKASEAEIQDLLEAIPPDCDYEDWLRVGMALHHAGEDISVWESWSSKGKKYQEGDCERWYGFTGSDTPVTLGTLRKLGVEAGWDPGATLARDVDQGDLWSWVEAQGTLKDVAKAAGVSLTEARRKAKAARIAEKLSNLPDETVRYVCDDSTWWIQNEIHGWHKARASDISDLLGEGANEIRRELIRKGWRIVGEPFEPEELVGRRWNLRGAKLIEPEPGDWPTIRETIDHVSKDLDDPEYLYKWAAFMVQKPQGKLPALFLYSSAQSTGKSSFHMCLAKLFRRGAVDGTATVTGDDGSRFNQELEGAVLCYFDEQKATHSGIDKLKKFITEPTIVVEAKGVDRREVPNLTHWVITSNHADTLPLDSNDSRVTMFEVPELKEIMDKHAYEERVTREAPAFLDFLLNYELPEPEGRLQLPIIQTAVKAAVTREETNPVVRFCAKTPGWVYMSASEIGKAVGLDVDGVERGIPMERRTLWRVASKLPVQGSAAEISDSLDLGLSARGAGRMISRWASEGWIKLDQRTSKGVSYYSLTKP